MPVFSLALRSLLNRRVTALLTVLAMTVKQLTGLALALLDGEMAGQSKRVKTVQVAPGGQHVRRAQQIATTHGRYETSIKRLE